MAMGPTPERQDFVTALREFARREIAVTALRKSCAHGVAT
jgi:hypothetical protein